MQNIETSPLSIKLYKNDQNPWGRKRNQALHGIGTGDNFLDNTPKAEEKKAKLENLFKSNFQNDMNCRVNIWNM